MFYVTKALCNPVFEKFFYKEFYFLTYMTNLNSNFITKILIIPKVALISIYFINN